MTNPKPKRIITPHKGGRTTYLQILMTPAEKQRLRTLAKQQGVSMGHYINSLLTEAYRKMENKS